MQTRLKLQQDIADHLKRHGPVAYEVVRDHADYAPWFGTHLGHRGEKRFDRMVEKVRARQPRKVSGGRPAASDQTAAGVLAPVAERTAHVEVKQLASGGAPSFEALQGLLVRRLNELEIAISDCFNEDGEIIDLEAYGTLSTLQQRALSATAQLSKQYHSALSAPAVMELMFAELMRPGQDPARALDTIAKLSALLGRQTGLPAVRSHQ